MLFTGEYEHTIDAKQRVAIPAEIRACLRPEIHGTAFYLSPGRDQSLGLWPELTFEAMAGTLGGAMLRHPQQSRFEALFFSQSTRVELDKVGRIRLPDRLCRMAQLTDRVVILGSRDHLQLRNPAQWEAIRPGTLDELADVTEQARHSLERMDESS